MNLLLAAGNDETGDWQDVPLAGNTDISHVRSVYVQGTLGGATVTIEASPEQVDTAPVARNTSVVTTISALGITNISVRARQLRAKTAGGTGTDLDVIIV